MQKKVVLVAFNGELMCFIHVLLHALDMKERGYEVKVVIEGSATRLLKEFDSPGTPFAELYKRVKEAGLIDCVCQACSAKMGTISHAEAQHLSLCNEMSGHPSFAKYLEQGFEMLTF